MRIDPLQQYARLKQELTEEKGRLEARLQQINQVLGTEPAAPGSTAGSPVPAQAAQPGRKGRGRGGNAMSIREVMERAISERGPLSRKELGQAVLELGYRSKAKNVLGSIGNILYGKNSPFISKEGKFFLASSPQTRSSPAAQADNGQASARRKRRKMSPEARARIGEAQRARRARERAGQ